MTAVIDTGSLSRVPPHDLNAEQCVLGGMLMNADVIPDVVAKITAADYYRPAHQEIHRVILRLWEDGQPTDWVTVNDQFAKRGDSRLVDGGLYLHDLISAVPLAENAGHFARIVREKAVLRRVIEAGARAVQLGQEAVGDADDIAERARQAMEDAVAPIQSSDLPTAAEVFYEVLDILEREEERGLPYPWADLNEVTSGLLPGEVVVIGGSSGTGKSLAGLNLCAHAALRLGVPTLIWTGEMKRHEVMMRLISAEGRVPMWNLLHKQLDQTHWDRIEAVRERISASPLFIDDRSPSSLADVRARLRKMARTRPAGLLFVDYLGLLREPDRSENRQTAVAALSRGLKQIAGEFGIPVVLAAQLNREMDKRHDKRPQPSDLRESAAIEHDASVIILLYREDVHGEETPRAGEIDFIVGKNRNGPPATITMGFQGAYARIVDLAPAWANHSAHGGQP